LKAIVKITNELGRHHHDWFQKPRIKGIPNRGIHFQLLHANTWPTKTESMLCDCPGP
jgi:hypothetical protein